MSSINFTFQEYLAALKRLRALIADGLSFRSDDDDTPGNKSTSCSWGLCSDDRAQWPDPEMHLWPKQFISHGRVAPKYFHRHHFCPFDSQEGNLSNGCFYRCRHFQKNLRPTKAQALEMFDKTIKEAVEAHK